MIKKNLGFTLIEILVVVAVLGLLTTIVLFSVAGIRAKSRDTRRVGDIKSIQEALGMYNNNHQFYPISDGYITGNDAMSTALTDDLLISGAPVDPIDGEIDGVTYKYYYQSLQGDTYVIEYYLETDSIHNKPQGLNTATP
ncbi:MAG: prepilin-type N-terminal cleavage/methylation domain-containing protein [Patescibacteria group bacterium]|nr:prepilin-type N-terminal cleavage/methylation domain-containing protein [Patescibacteria group bacterium]